MRRVAKTFGVLALVALVLVLSPLCVGTVALASEQDGAELKPYLQGIIKRDWDPEVPTPAWPGMTVARHACAENTGEFPMRARMSYRVYWARLTPTGWEEARDLDTSLIGVELADLHTWVPGGDGWYYYADAIQPKEQSANFIKTMSVSSRVGEETRGKAGVSSKYVGAAAIVEVFLECAAAGDNPVNPDEPVTPGWPGQGQATYAGRDAGGYASGSGRIAQTSDQVLPWSIAAVVGGMTLLAGVFVAVAARRRRKKSERDDDER